MLDEKNSNDALQAESEYRTAVESASEYIENFDILETITNVGNDEVFTPRKTCDMVLDSLPEEVWHNPNYKWLNPATKNGIFEREIALRLDKGLKDVIPDTEKRRKHILQDMIYAIGQTRFTANVARRTLYYCSQANRKCDGIKAEDGHYVNGYAIGNGSWFDDPEGNIKTPNTGHTFVSDGGKPMPASCATEEKKKYKCKYCGIKSTSAYNDPSQRETYAYEFIHYGADELLKRLQDRFFGGNRNMKFDIIIGNPPYQLSDGGGKGSSALPIYDKFVEQAIALNPLYISMIISARWFSGGRGLDDFRSRMLTDRHISKLFDYVDAHSCFPSINLKGGVCCFLRDATYDGDCYIESTDAEGNKTVSKRPLLESGLSTYIRDPKLIPILKKVVSKGLKSFSKIVSSNDPYGFDSRESGSYKRVKPKFSLTKLPESASLYYYGWQKDGLGYIERKNVTKGIDLIDTIRVFIPKAWGTGNRRTDFLNGFIVGFGSVSTETYLTVGPFDDEQSAQNCLHFMHTKFFRFLVSALKITQNAMQNVYEFVPLVDMSKYWDDEKLYEEFGFSNEEKTYIENEIGPETAKKEN